MAYSLKKKCTEQVCLRQVPQFRRDSVITYGFTGKEIPQYSLNFSNTVISRLKRGVNAYMFLYSYYACMILMP